MLAINWRKQFSATEKGHNGRRMDDFRIKNRITNLMQILLGDYMISIYFFFLNPLTESLKSLKSPVKWVSTILPIWSISS